jgi:hypothetical protein
MLPWLLVTLIDSIRSVNFAGFPDSLYSELKEAQESLPSNVFDDSNVVDLDYIQNRIENRPKLPQPVFIEPPIILAPSVLISSSLSPG